MRIAINAAIIENGKILLARKNQSWILPGGKPESNETDLECLCREVGEELSGIQLNNIRYYREFEGITPYKGDVLKARVYFADILGKIFPPAAEIIAYDWVGDKSRYNLSDITFKIVDSLIKEGYIEAQSN